METKIKTIANFRTAVKNKKVTGYIWMVSSDKPIIYKDPTEIDFSTLYNEQEPHNKIQEAYLFDGVNSIHIKNIDGEELIFIHEDDDFTGDNYKTKTLKFPSHIITGKHLEFLQVYKLEPSIISGSDFKTWQPIVRLFKGFSNTQNN